MSEGYCDRHRWLHEEGHAAVLPCRNWKAEENMSHQDNEKNKRLRETIANLPAMSEVKQEARELVAQDILDADKTTGSLHMVDQEAWAHSMRAFLNERLVARQANQPQSVCTCTFASAAGYPRMHFDTCPLAPPQGKAQPDSTINDELHAWWLKWHGRRIDQDTWKDLMTALSSIASADPSAVMTEKMLQKLAKLLHFRLAAAQDLPYEEGDVCADCVNDAADFVRSLASAEPPQPCRVIRACSKCGQVHAGADAWCTAVPPQGEAEKEGRT